MGKINSKLIGFIFTFILLIGCNSNEVDFGRVIAEKDGENWKADAFLKVDTEGEFSFSFTKRENGINVESIAITNIPNQLAKYDNVYFLENTQHSIIFVTLTSDGDVLEDIYILDANKNENFLEIIEINIEEGYVKGNFDLAFIIDPDSPKINEGATDYITFKDAIFAAQ